MSSSRKSILKRTKSGLKVTQVKSLPLYFLISGSDLWLIFSLNTCLNFNPREESAVSMINSEEKIFASLAPYPFRPPVVFCSSSSKLLPTEMMRCLLNEKAILTDLSGGVQRSALAHKCYALDESQQGFHFHYSKLGLSSHLD
jgi:hypothetical protein